MRVMVCFYAAGRG